MPIMTQDEIDGLYAALSEGAMYVPPAGGPGINLSIIPAGPFKREQNDRDVESIKDTSTFRVRLTELSGLEYKGVFILHDEDWHVLDFRKLHILRRDV